MKLNDALKEIEKQGSNFNALSQYDEFYGTNENNAYSVIVDYMIANNIKVGDYNWDEIFEEYKEEGFVNIADTIHEIHNEVSMVYEMSDLENYPLDLILLFKTFTNSFHYPHIKSQRKIIYIDMDNVIVDFPSAFVYYDTEFLEKCEDKDEIDGIFSKMNPMKEAIKSVELLFRYFDVYILSTAPWNNPSAWTDKLNWIKKYLPIVGYKRLILSHNKNLNAGDYLIDDRIKNGVLTFKGEHIHFGTEKFPNWEVVVNYLLNKEKIKNKQINKYEHF